MKRRRQARRFSIIASLLLIFSLFTPAFAGAESSASPHTSLRDSAEVVKHKLNSNLMEEFDKQQNVRFLIKFKEQADPMKAAQQARAKAQANNLSAFNQEIAQRSAVIAELKATAESSQRNVANFLEAEARNGNVKDIQEFYIVNVIAVTASKEIAEKIATFPEVEEILPNQLRQLVKADINQSAADIQPQSIEWNVEIINAPDAWGVGGDGTGAVVANIDSGVEWEHPALKEKYRGYNSETGEVDHTYSFFDPVNGQTEPYDIDGHGTHTMGTMVGSEPDGSNQVGVAPGAKWIAVQAFTPDGAYDDDLIEAGQWLMAPGGDVTKAPDVINNSWGGGPGIDEFYRPMVQAWRAANIFPTFAAGNTTLFNPGGPGSVAVPANYPESFAVGATNSNNELAAFSLKGPSPYDETKPEIVAPGVSVRSSYLGGGYATASGTSMAAPAVSGVVALLRATNKSLTVDEIEQILMNTAAPLIDNEYPESPNNGYGHGLVDAFAAVSTVADGIGTVEGQVTMDGEDTEAPVYEHNAPQETYEGLDLKLNISVSDNVSVTSVKLQYGDQSIDANRISGDFKSGEYEVTIPGEDIEIGTFTYNWIINDFGNNEVVSDSYNVEVKPGITNGYFEDFESNPAGWQKTGENNVWEWGTPTSGPEAAYSGENVYATNLAGQYPSRMEAYLVMPPVQIPNGENSYLQFKSWHEFEQSSITGRAWDYGRVVVSTDMENWTDLAQFEGASEDWVDAEVDLSEYAGQTIYVGFYAYSDGSVTRLGWYIDDVALSDTSLNLENNPASPKIITNSPEEEKAKEAELEKEEKANNIGLGMIGLGMNETSTNGVITTPAIVKDSIVKDSDKKQASGLPLAATVSVLESGRSVATNPQDGSYSLLLPAGDYTLVAETYGFRAQEQNVTITQDEVTTANFVLEEIPKYTISGTVSSANSGNPIANATLLLVEDANIEPVQTDENGNFSLTAYEGEYTLKVLAQDYYGQEVEVSIDANKTVDIALEPFFTIPGGEIGYDDGTAENARVFYEAGNGWAVKMSLPEGEEQAFVTHGVFQFHGTDWPNPGATNFQVEVWSAGEDGLPAEKLAGPIEAEAIRDLNQWTVVDLTEHNIQVDGDFFMTYIQTTPNPNAPGLATDESSPNAGRSYEYVSGSWAPSPAIEGNYMIRARIAYGVGDPVITTPENESFTNEAELTVEGTASPTTTISLLNNGTEVGTAEVDDDGAFSLDIELTEGANELKAVTVVKGEEATESEPVTITLDTVAPELEITNVQDGDRTNRETLTVEGTVNDENLASVTVNGQEASVQEGTFSRRILLDEGENAVEVVATDAAGNSTTQVITVEADFEAPVIENVTPTEDMNVKPGQTVKITFDSETDLDAFFVIHMPLTNVQSDNVTKLPMFEMSEGHYVAYWTVPGGIVAEGAVIEVIAIDSFGNETRAEATGKLYISDGNNSEDDDSGNGNGNGKGKGKGNGNNGNGNGNNGKGNGNNGNGNGNNGKGNGNNGNGNGNNGKGNGNNGNGNGNNGKGNN